MQLFILQMQPFPNTHTHYPVFLLQSSFSVYPANNFFPKTRFFPDIHCKIWERFWVWRRHLKQNDEFRRPSSLVKSLNICAVNISDMQATRTCWSWKETTPLEKYDNNCFLFSPSQQGIHSQSQPWLYKLTLLPSLIPLGLFFS